jgi:hypothetical protein
MTHDPHDDHETFIKTPKQLILAVLLAFIVPIIIITLIIQLVMGGKTADNATPEQVAARIKPVAGFVLVEGAAPAPTAALTAVAAVAMPGVAIPAAAPAAAGKVDGEKSYKSVRRSLATRLPGAHVSARVRRRCMNMRSRASMPCRPKVVRRCLMLK